MYHANIFLQFVNIGGSRVVLVSINYRLGPLGYLSLEEIYNEDPSNYPSYGGMNGILDQITALKWIQRNIGDFGGDKNKVTIFGESAGGLSTCYLLVSPLAKGLFHQVIDISGAW